MVGDNTKMSSMIPKKERINQYRVYVNQGLFQAGVDGKFWNLENIFLHAMLT